MKGAFGMSDPMFAAVSQGSKRGFGLDMYSNLLFNVSYRGGKKNRNFVSK